MDVRRVEVFKVTEWRDKSIFKTKKIKSVWIPSDADETLVAKHHGGDILANTMDWKFGVSACEPLGQLEAPV